MNYSAGFFFCACMALAVLTILSLGETRLAFSTAA